MFQLNRQSMRFNDKLYIVKKTINGERINDLELAIHIQDVNIEYMIHYIFNL